MKKLLIISIVFLVGGLAFGATNAFQSFGDCEAKIWLEATGDNSANIDTDQFTTPGMVGNCVEVFIPPLWTRFQASTLDQATVDILSGTDPSLEFYYKIVGDGYGTSYPYIYFRQGITDNGASPHPAGGADKVVYWSRNAVSGVGGEKFISDGAWHLFDPDISDFTWAGQNADMVNNLLSYEDLLDPLFKSQFHIDEITLIDPTPPVAIVDDWGLY